MDIRQTIAAGVGALVLGAGTFAGVSAVTHDGSKDRKSVV